MSKFVIGITLISGALAVGYLVLMCLGYFNRKKPSAGDQGSNPVPHPHPHISPSQKRNEKGDYEPFNNYKKRRREENEN